MTSDNSTPSEEPQDASPARSTSGAEPSSEQDRDEDSRPAVGRHFGHPGGRPGRIGRRPRILQELLRGHARRQRGGLRRHPAPGPRPREPAAGTPGPAHAHEGCAGPGRRCRSNPTASTSSRPISTWASATASCTWPSPSRSTAFGCPSTSSSAPWRKTGRNGRSASCFPGPARTARWACGRSGAPAG